MLIMAVVLQGVILVSILLGLGVEERGRGLARETACGGQEQGAQPGRGGVFEEDVSHCAGRRFGDS